MHYFCEICPDKPAKKGDAGVNNITSATKISFSSINRGDKASKTIIININYG